MSASADPATATDVDATRLPFAKLRGRENWSMWKRSMMFHLRMRNLGHTIQAAESGNTPIQRTPAPAAASGATPTSAAFDPTPEEADKAMMHIWFAVEEHVATHIMEAETANAAWTKLKSLYEDRDMSAAVYYNNQFIALRQEDNESIRDWAGRITRFVAEAAMASTAFDSVRQTLKLIDNSRHHFDVIKPDLQTRMELDGLTFEQATKALSGREAMLQIHSAQETQALALFNRLKPNGANQTSSSSSTPPAPGSRKKLPHSKKSDVCTHCAHTGHTVDICNNKRNGKPAASADQVKATREKVAEKKRKQNSAPPRLLSLNNPFDKSH